MIPFSSATGAHAQRFTAHDGLSLPILKEFALFTFSRRAARSAWCFQFVVELSVAPTGISSLVCTPPPVPTVTFQTRPPPAGIISWTAYISLLVVDVGVEYFKRSRFDTVASVWDLWWTKCHWSIVLWVLSFSLCHSTDAPDSRAIIHFRRSMDPQSIPTYLQLQSSRTQWPTVVCTWIENTGM